MERFDRISSIFWLCFSSLVGIESYRLGLGTLHKPGPGFLFFWASLFLGMMSLVVLFRTWAREKAEKSKETLIRREHLPKVVFVLVSVFLYAIFMETIGFIPVTLLLFLFILGVLERKRWVLAILVSIVVTACAYLIFEVWLKSQLPKGFLEFLRI